MRTSRTLSPLDGTSRTKVPSRTYSMSKYTVPLVMSPYRRLGTSVTWLTLSCRMAYPPKCALLTPQQPMTCRNLSTRQWRPSRTHRHHPTSLSNTSPLLERSYTALHRPGLTSLTPSECSAEP
eukprot:5271316-Pleurochrysis_carterae.AAC.1